MNVLIDANVAHDVILEREPWLGDSKGVWDACYHKRITGRLVATSLTNLFYVSWLIIGTERARAGVDICLETFEVLPVGRPDLERADLMVGSDFEDNVSLACAINGRLDTIVTRNPIDFGGSPVLIPTPSELVALLAKTPDA